MLNILVAEIAELKHSLARVKGTYESSHRKEMDEIKEKYNEKVADMLKHIRNLDSELMEKGLLLNKALRFSNYSFLYYFFYDLLYPQTVRY